MFCKRCGAEAQDNALYCQNDGAALVDINDSFLLHKIHNQFCSQCSCENSSDSLYCINCGVMLCKIGDKTSSIAEGSANQKTMSIPVQTSFSGLSSNINLNGMKRSAGYAGLAIVITFLLSWIISLVLNGKLRDLFANDWTLNMMGDFKFISSTDLMMLSHMVGMKYSGSISILEGNLQTSGGFFLLLIIPLVSLTLVGYLSNRTTPQRLAIERLSTVALIAVIYAVLMAVISLFAGMSVSFQENSIISEGILFKTSYRFMPALLHSLILGFIFTALGSFFGMSNAAKQQGTNISYGISVQRAVISAVAGIMICMVLVSSIMNSRAEFSDNEMPGAISTAISTQVGGYYWGLTHFNSLSMGVVDPYGDNEEIKYSMLGGLSSTSGDTDSEEFDSVIGGMWYLILLPILLHIWAGRQLLRAQSKRFINELVAYAVSFGMISALFAYMSKVRIHSNLDENFEIHFGFSFLSTLLLSAIVALVFAYIGALIFNRNVMDKPHINEGQNMMRQEG